MSMSMRIRFILAASCLFVSAAQAKQSSKSSRTVSAVSDSLVKNLSCQGLSVDNIYRAIRDDAFSSSRHMPLANWDFWARGLKIGNCWGLSSMQRMMFYMGRFGESNPQTVQQRRDLVMQMASEKRSPEVFFVEQNSLDPHSEFWNSIRGGYEYKGEIFNIRGDIQDRQVNRFFRSKNLKMIYGSGATSAKENKETVQRLIKNLNNKRLSLVNLRLARTNQHVVIVKSVHQSGPLWVFKAYDSNIPENEHELIYNTRSGEFTSGQIFAFALGQTEAAKRPLGVFIVDEDKTADIDEALLKFYRSKCN